MADNTQLGNGDFIRDIDRSVNPVPVAAKTQVMQIDVGGQNAESLVSQQNPLPVTTPRFMAYAQLMELKVVLSNPANGFVPLEIPEFLGGL